MTICMILDELFSHSRFPFEIEDCGIDGIGVDIDADGIPISRIQGIKKRGTADGSRIRTTWLDQPVLTQIINRGNDRGNAVFGHLENIIF